MKSIYLPLCILMSALSLKAQEGLERIIVEKYYVSDANDKSVDGDGGELPLESVTYRVYVDMLPGYIFQAAFGVPEHELKIATTTKFFNNEDRGGRHPTYSRNQAQNNTVMLDSWLSVGAGLRDHIGLLKTRDDGVDNIVNADGVLQNNHPEANIPLTEQDGVIPGTSEPVTVVGFFDTDLSILDDTNDGPVPAIISSRDGAWSSLNGSTGPDPDENIVLIGQFTTDGIFEFELNLQIRNEQTLDVEKYVARNPIDEEVLFDGLIHIDSLGLMSAVEDFSFLSQRLNVYPNPSSGDLTIQIEDDVQLNLGTDNYFMQSMDGRILVKGRLTGHQTPVNLTSLPDGIYTLFVEINGGFVHAEKVMVVH